jgi:hypothetical protein
MLNEPFVFKARKTPSGKYFAEVLYKGVVVATGKQKFNTCEEALTRVTTAIENLDLASAIRPNGKIVELL